MKKNVYLLTLYLNELHLWLKTGIKIVNKNRLIKASIKKEKLSITKTLPGKIKKTLPEYDDDFEIVIVEIPEERVAKLINSGSEFNLDFEFISKIYPITSRGSSLLKGKLDDRIILSNPIFEKFFLEFSKENEKNLSVRGAKGLLKIFDFGNYEEQFTPNIISLENAIALREKDQKISPDKDYLENLILYDRSKPFPNNDLGYFYDLGAILKIYENNDDILRGFANTLEKFKGSDYRAFDSIILELHNSEIIQNLEKNIKENVLVASIIFLILRGDIRESNDLERSRLFNIVSNEFLKINYEKEIALALWLTGYFFGFEMIADLYYKKFNAEVLRFDKPFPELKGNKIQLKSLKDNPQQTEPEPEVSNQADLKDNKQDKSKIQNEKKEKTDKDDEFTFQLT